MACNLSFPQYPGNLKPVSSPIPTTAENNTWNFRARRKSRKQESLWKLDPMFRGVHLFAESQSENLADVLFWLFVVCLLACFSWNDMTCGINVKYSFELPMILTVSTLSISVNELFTGTHTCDRAIWMPHSTHAIRTFTANKGYRIRQAEMRTMSQCGA